MVKMIAAAQRALAKGEERATTAENESLRRWLAGDLPYTEAAETKEIKTRRQRMSRAVRESQRGAAQLRAAWKREGNPEMARRATREGGATGARWRGVGMDTWRQTMQAMQVTPDDPMTDVNDENQRTFTAAGSFDGARPGHVFKNGAHGLGYYRESTTTTDRQKEPRGERHGWTIAHALIQHMRRKQTRTQERQRAARAAPPTTQADGAGKGVVVFDVETTKLIGETDNIEDLEVSVATALWVGDGDKPTDGTWMTAWHDTVRKAPGGGDTRTMSDLLTWMDGARIIVAYNGADFDMRVLRKYYGNDDDRWHSHLRKLHDPAQQVRRAVGRKVKLDKLLQLNGMAGKAGSGADAPRWWTEGAWQKLATYCERDTEALAELVYRTNIKVPGGTTHEASVHSALEGRKTAQRQHSEEEEEAAQHRNDPQRPRAATAASATTTTTNTARELEPAQREEDGAHTRAEAHARGKRKAQTNEGSAPQRARENHHDGNDGTPCAYAGTAGTSTSHAEERANDTGHTEMHNDTAAAASQRRADDTNGEMTAGHIATGNGGRPKRATHHGEYDEVNRRKRRRTQASAYMDRGGRRTASGAVKRGAIAIGAAAMEWITRGQYEWRDQRFAQVRGKRRKFWST